MLVFISFIDCPISFDFHKYLPADIRHMVKCVQPPNCWGIDCSLDLTFTIPLGNIRITKNIPFWFKIDPCDFAIDIGFGTRTLLKTRLLQYEFGKCPNESID